MPIHLFWGDDIGAIDRSLNAFINQAIDPNWISINLSRLDGQNHAQALQSLEEVRTPPFGSGHRVIILNKSPFFNGCSSELSSQFESVLDLIPQTSHLVLISQNKPDGRLKTTKLINELIKNKKAFEKKFLLPAIWDEIGQKQLIQRTANEMNIEIEEKAIYSLVEAIGSDSQRLVQELEKLFLLEEAKSKKQNVKKLIISQETVNELCQEITSNSLEICSYLLANQLGEAITRLDSLINQGEPALRILASLTTQIRGWLWVSLLEQDGQKEVGFIAKQAGIANPKRIYVIRKQIRGKAPSFFIDLLKKVLEVEILLKKGMTPKNAFRDCLLT